MFPLVTLTLVSNVVMLSYCSTDMPFKRRRYVRQLYSNGGNKLASATSILSASGEEKTCSKTFLVIVFTGDSACDSRLAGAGHAVQPEDAPFVTPISPSLNLVENVHSGILEA